jgi:hypothetical protein
MLNCHQPFYCESGVSPIKYKLKHQVCGIYVSVTLALFNLCRLYFTLLFDLSEGNLGALRLFADFVSMAQNVVAIYFFFEIIRVPEYLAGKPEFSKFWPFIFGAGCSFLRSILLCFASSYSLEQLLPSIVFYFVMTWVGLGVGYLMFMLDDEKGSCCLCFKPFVYVRSEPDPYSYINAVQYPGYPIKQEAPPVASAPNPYNYPSLQRIQ